MVYGAILAGGVGSRMNYGELPKQFLFLGDKPIIIYTLEKFLTHKRVDRILLGINPDWITYALELLDKYGYSDRVEVVRGGSDRNSSLMNVINHIEKNFGIQEEDIILTHDAVRPFLSSRIIDDNIDATLKYKACGTVIAAQDTPVKSKGGEFIEAMPLRSELYLCQTPQSFNIKMFMDCCDKLSEEDKYYLTDATGICVQSGQEVFLVLGDPLNFKITTKSDYKIANAMLLSGEKL